MLLNRSPIEIGYLEFHNKRQTLANGTYRVTEADGDINYALIDGDIKWYSEREFDEAVLEQGRMDYLDQQLMFDPDDDLDEELLNSWDIAMHRDHDEFRRVDPHDFANDDDREADEHLVVEMSKPGKTLGELLRESMNRPDSVIKSPLFNERPIIEDDGNGLEVELDDEDVTVAEHEAHKADLDQFMQASSEQLDRSMTNKTADLGDLL